MTQQRWLGAVFAIVLLVISCTSAKPQSTASASASPMPTASTTPPAPASPSPVPSEIPSPTAPPVSSWSCPAAQPAPQFAAFAPTSRSLALVWLRGSERLVLRDLTDFNHPSTQNYGNLPWAGGAVQFVGPAEMSYGPGDLLFRVPLNGSHGKVAARLCLGQIGFGWSPNGTTLAFVTDRRDNDRSELHLVTAGKNRVIDTMPRYYWGVGCAGQPCEDNSDARLLFSPDGKFISLVQVWGGPALRVWTAAGKTLKSIDANAPTGVPTMSVWSGTSLYYRDSRGVERWRDGLDSLALPGVQWIRPKASPAGGQVVYMARKAGVPGVYMFDTGSGTVRLIKSFRSEPVFLTSRYLWFRGEKTCTAADPYPCGSQGTSVATGKTYVYDLQTGVETESTITKVWDVWPHPA